jgi:hypothetical protein
MDQHGSLGHGEESEDNLLGRSLPIWYVAGEQRFADDPHDRFEDGEGSLPQSTAPIF